MSSTNAIIIAAGLGSRLSPLTKLTPKPLTKVFGVPLIERNIRLLIEAGISEIIIVVGYKAEMFNYLTRYQQVKIIFNDKFSEANNIYSLYLARNYLKNTFILDGDLYIKDNIFKSAINQSINQ